MPSFKIQGAAAYAEINSTAKGVQTLTINVQPNCPLLFAVLCEPNTGAALPDDAISWTVTDSGGNQIDSSFNTATQYVVMENGQPYAIGILNPDSGNWSIAVSGTTTTAFRAAIAAADPGGNTFNILMEGAAPYYPGDLNVSVEDFTFGLCVWLWLPLAVIAASATASGAAIALPSVLQSAVSISQASASQLAGDLTGAVDVATLGISQVTGCTFPEQTQDVITNGFGAEGLENWTIEPEDDSWDTDELSDPLFPFAFVTSSRKFATMSRRIDLIADGGLTAGYLDQAPMIDVTVHARSTQLNPSLKGKFRFSVSLLDANENPIKTYQIATVKFPRSSGWKGGGCSFYGYGPGVRYVSYQHSARLAPTDEEPGHRISFPEMQVTGVEVDVHLAMPDEPPELVTNPSGASQLSGWTISSGSFTVDPANGRYCPGTSGTTAFATASDGWNVMTQTIDLSSLYTVAQLDAQPVISVSDWIGLMPSVFCQYELIVTLLNGSGGVLQTFDSGVRTLAANLSQAPSFIYVPADLENYGTGLQQITITRRALSSASGIPALVAGASVVLYLNSVETVVETTGREATADLKGTRVTDTTVAPYMWVAATRSDFASGPSEWGSGWAIAGAGKNLLVVTAGHNVYGIESKQWAKSANVVPGQAFGGMQPFGNYQVSGANMQISFDFLAIDQAFLMQHESNDYGAFYVAQVSKPASGFTAVTPTLPSSGSAVIIGYPGNYSVPPYRNRPMYSEQVSLSDSGTAIGVNTDFGAGTSGGPICQAENTSSAIGIFVNSGGKMWQTPQATALSASVLADLTAWLTPLATTDVVTDFRFVLQTASETYAGTDAGILIEICGIEYRPLSRYWVGPASAQTSQNERGRWDGYDLTAPLLADQPNLTVNDLLGTTFAIGVISGDEMGYFAGWKLASVIFFVNRHRFTLKVANAWLPSSDGDLRYSSKFELS